MEAVPSRIRGRRAGSKMAVGRGCVCPDGREESCVVR